LRKVVLNTVLFYIKLLSNVLLWYWPMERALWFMAMALPTWPLSKNDHDSR